MSNIIAILGDLHLGVKNASKHHHAYMESVLMAFFSEIESRKIKTVIQLGDLFDSRTHTVLWTIDFFERVIQPEIDRLKLDWKQLCGNHDSYYRETLDINSPRLHLSNRKNIQIIDSVTEMVIGADKFLLIPWMNKTNTSEILERIETSDAKYVCGHFEFNGFDMARGQPARSHFNHAIFGKFERVYSGHYHTASTKDNVVYAGTPYELSWSDCSDDKSFLIHSKKTYERVLTKETLYHKIRYSANCSIPDGLTNKYVRVLVTDRPDKLKFNAFIHEIEKQNPFDLKVQETFSDELSEEVSTVSIKETRDVIIEYLNNSEVDLDKERILAIFEDLQNHAIAEMV